jgi:hypothetical protein
MSSSPSPLRRPHVQNRLYAVGGGLTLLICVASIAHSLIFQFVLCPQCGRPMHESGRYRETSTGGVVVLYDCKSCDFSVMR